MQNASCDIGLIGLAVMGQNLVLNMNDHGYKVAVFNRTVSKVDDFIQNEAKGTQVVGAHSIEELVEALKKPAPRDVDGEGRRDGRPDDRPGGAASGEGRHHHRRRQFALSLIPTAAPRPCGKGHPVHRHRRFRRRRRRALWPVDHARRQSGGLAAREGNLPVDCGQGRRWLALLRLGGRGRRGPLREDGPQRHRVRRHAADLRSVPVAEGWPGPERRTNFTRSSPSGTRASSTAT